MEKPKEMPDSDTRFFELLPDLFEKPMPMRVKRNIMRKKLAKKSRRRNR